MIAPSRGDIYSVTLDPTKGHEQGGTRPCLVISANKFNHGPADLVVVIPITSRYKKIASHVQVRAGEAGLSDDSYIKCEEVRCVSKERFGRYWGSIRGPTLASVEQWVRVVLEL
jgi:mRNA interferase MazF